MTLVERNESDWSSPGAQVFLVGSLGSYGGGGGGTFRSTFKIQCLEVFVCSSPVLKPRGGLDIFTYGDQQSIFLGFEFRKSIFWGTGQSCSIWFFFWGGGGLSNKCCIFKCLTFPTVFF